jgi:predicted Fe-Mo cluster-binding NifX family protein
LPDLVKKGDKMNIAVSTTDGKTICGHLGKCRSFIIFETDGKEIKDRRTISAGGLCPGHGPEAGAQGHNVSPFDGCQAVITQGMGQGMLNSLAAAGIQPVMTNLTDPDAAVMDFLSGRLSGTARSNCSCGEHGH